jgi:hypothetical protein
MFGIHQHFSECSTLSFTIGKTMNREVRYENRIALRLPTEEKQRLEELIEKGKFRNLSQVIRIALNEFLKKNN